MGRKIAEDIVEIYTSPDAFENLGIEKDEDNYGFSIASEGFWKMRADAEFGCNTEVLSKVFSDSVDTWQYYFVNTEPIMGGHGMEVDYVFGVLNFDDPASVFCTDDPTLCYITGSFLKNDNGASEALETFLDSQNDYLTDQIMDSWRKFIYGENPGWPQFTRENQYYRQFGPGDEVTTQEGSRPGCDELLSLEPEQMQKLI